MDFPGSVYSYLFPFVVPDAIEEMLECDRPEVRATVAELVKGLDLPRFVASMPLAVGMVGLPGSGKSLVARALAEELDAVAIEAATVRHELARRGLGHGEVLPVLLGVGAAVLRAGRQTVFDLDCVDPGLRSALIRLADRCHGRVRFVRTVCDLRLAMERLAAARPTDPAAPPGGDPRVETGAGARLVECLHRLPAHYDGCSQDGGVWRPRELPVPDLVTVDTRAVNWRLFVEEAAADL